MPLEEFARHAGEGGGRNEQGREAEPDYVQKRWLLLIINPLTIDHDYLRGPPLAQRS